MNMQLSLLIINFNMPKLVTKIRVLEKVAKIAPLVPAIVGLAFAAGHTFIGSGGEICTMNAPGFPNWCVPKIWPR